MRKIIFFVLLLLSVFLPSNTFAINEVNVYFFHSNTCDVCNQEKAYLEALKLRYPNMRVYSYEISENNNNNLMEQVKSLYGETRTGVPYTVIGDAAYLGFSQNSKAVFQKRVYEYSTISYQNQVGNLLGISYRNDLEGEVQEYKTNDQYQIEEHTNHVSSSSSSTQKSSYDKYKVSFYLIGVGIFLALIAFLIYFMERREKR